LNGNTGNIGREISVEGKQYKGTFLS